MEYMVRVEYKDGDSAVYQFDSELKARAFCKEEVKWESVLRVLCKELGIDQAGDFANTQGE